MERGINKGLSLSFRRTIVSQSPQPSLSDLSSN